MATLDTLKWALTQKATASKLASTQPLSDAQYEAGFEVLMRGSGWMPYQEFIIPQLSQLLAPLVESRTRISVLEIGPGPKSVLGFLPDLQKRKIRRYAAFEPHCSFATRLEEWFCSASGMESPLPLLQSPPSIYRKPFALDCSFTGIGTDSSTNDGQEKFDLILFCHSMYGIKPRRRFIERAFDMLDMRLQGGIVVVFHRDGSLRADGLTCHQSACFPTGVTRVQDNEEALGCFASFIAGFVAVDVDMSKSIQAEWREVCRDLGRREAADPDHLVFSSPESMATFSRYSTMVPELTAQVPLLENGEHTIKNREARLHRPASIVRPTEVTQVQQCVRWALKYRASLTVVSGGHSGHCLWPNVVSIDMTAFNEVHILTAEDDGFILRSGSASKTLLVAETGCKTGDIVRKTMEARVAVPLGARPSVGAGLWLQGGIGHLARQHGLACDAIVGAVVVSVTSGQILYVGRVPSQLRPAGAVRPENQNDILWAIRGGGTNFGIVISVTFKTHASPTYSVRDWIVPLNDSMQARATLRTFGELVAGKLPQNRSADAYLYWNDADQLQLGVTMFETSTRSPHAEVPTTVIDTGIDTFLGPEADIKLVDGVGLFDTDMYMSRMHGGHGGGKTSSFKRCVFLKDIGDGKIANVLVSAMETRPSPKYYLHLLQGGGAVCDMAADATAFGCRDWEFACVITGVWSRDQDGTEIARNAVRWVYKVATELLPLGSGAYGADLGHDPRDAALAAEAFGPNRPRLARLKQVLDPCNILAHACPLPTAPMEPKLIILVTGESCAGKDYCADFWAFLFTTCAYNGKNLTARVVSISDAAKQEYAADTGADLNRLHWDRAYKEQHRPKLTAFFQDQVRKRPRLPEDHFLHVVYGASAAGVDVLLITGMRDEAPVATLSPWVPDSRLLEVRVQARRETRRARRGDQIGEDDENSGHGKDTEDSTKDRSSLAALDCFPTSSSLVFNNDASGNEAAKCFAEQYLFPFCHEDLQQLADMMRLVPDFPRPGIKFRHVLGIAEQLGGLSLCTTLLQNHCSRDWTKVDIITCCEVGGIVYASPLATRLNIPLALIRETGKLPPPTISVNKSQSHISSSDVDNLPATKMEMNQDLVSKNASVVVVDDVLATGKTLLAVLQLLSGEAEISTGNISVLVVAEFPVHRGRELLRRHGFGEVDVQSLLVLGGV